MSQKSNKTIINESVKNEINELAGDLGFGSIVLKIHDSKIIQVEITHKKRLDNIWRVDNGGGI